MSHSFDDEPTLKFMRTDDGNDELMLDTSESWLWSGDESSDARNDMTSRRTRNR